MQDKLDAIGRYRIIHNFETRCFELLDFKPVSDGEDGYQVAQITEEALVEILLNFKENNNGQRL